MTIIQLEYLLAVANCGSFSAAAEQCFVTQPSLSMQIKSLEEELGVVLLDRSRKPVIATEAGEVVIREAKQTMMAYNGIKESISELKGETTGKLRLGVIPTISPYLLHKFIPTFVAQYPKVELEVRDMVTADIIEALKRDQIDAAIVAGGVEGDWVVDHELFDDRFHMYISPDHPLASKKDVAVNQINMKDLVLLSAGNCMRDQVLEVCRAKQAGPASQYTFVSGSIDTLIRIVDCTPTLTIIPEMALEYIPARHLTRVKSLAGGSTSRKISVAVRRTYVKSSIVNALTDTIVSSVAGKLQLTDFFSKK
ncbi:MAG: hydrogen peroxide-inducible genes activator [Rikenellaceae bacterium]